MRSFVLILLAVSYLVSTPSLNAESSKQESEQKNPQAKTKKGTPQPPISIKVIESDYLNKTSQQEEAYKKENLELQRKVTDYTRDNLETQQKLTKYTWILACVAAIQIFLLIGQVCIAYKQSQYNKGMEKNQRIIERAYVKLSHIETGIIFNLFGTATGTFKLTNFGETPARITDVVLGKILLEGNAPLPTIPNYSGLDRKPMKAFLVRNEDLFFIRHFPLEGINDDLTREVRKLWFVGYVDYIDKFGERHRSGYASYFTPGGGTDNLSFVAQDGYNYDRPRKREEGNDWDEPA